MVNHFGRADQSVRPQAERPAKLNIDNERVRMFVAVDSVIFDS
jgi:hypothetical protein